MQLPLHWRPQEFGVKGFLLTEFPSTSVKQKVTEKPCKFCAILNSSFSDASQDANQIVQSQQVPILPVALLPGDPVIQCLPIRKKGSLSKIDQPHIGIPTAIMYKK